jgi:hypothetical protein
MLIKCINKTKREVKLSLFLEFPLDLLPTVLLQGEHALPQQFIHVFKDGHFETTPVSHSGG